MRYCFRDYNMEIAKNSSHAITNADSAFTM